MKTSKDSSIISTFTESLIMSENDMPQFKISDFYQNSMVDSQLENKYIADGSGGSSFKNTSLSSKSNQYS